MNLPVNKFIVDRKIKVLLVGCGRISKKHIEAIQTHEKDLELVAVCDINKHVLIESEKKLNVKGYTTLNDALYSSNADLFVICTPSGLHPKQVIQCADAGKHIVTEKPMATRWKDGIEMVKVCDRADTLLFVVKQNRYNNTLRLLKKRN